MSKDFESWQDSGLCGIVVDHGTKLELIVCDGIRVSGNMPYFPIINLIVPIVARRGDEISISGQGFGSVQKTSVISLGGKKMHIESWSENTIRARIPLDAKTGKVTLITSYGTVTSQAPLQVNID